jgi:hypothetical protein
LLALAGVLRTAPALAAPTASGFADGRAGQSLDGAWHVIVDPYDNGLLDYRNQLRPNGYFEDAPPKNRSDLVEYDFARSPTLELPGDWNTQRPELHGDALTRFSEEHQADLYRRQLAMLRRVPAIRGMSPWILVDFRSPRRPLPGAQDGWNRKGLVANDGTKKQAFGVLRDACRALAAGSRPKAP